MIEASRISKVFRRGRGLFARGEVVRALDDVTLTLHQGEILGLVGLSGSGKSTLGLILCGAMEPTSGQVLLTESRRAPRCQMVFQDPRESLNPRMTLEEIVGEPLRCQSGGLFAGVVGAHERRQRVSQVMEQVQLGPRLLTAYPHQLSGGQRQRVALARAIIGNPDLIVADEPTSLLDVTVSAEILSVLATLSQKQGVTMVFTTHDLALAAHLCARIAFLDRGKLVELGPTSEVIAHPRSQPVRTLVAAARKRDEILGLLEG